MLRSRPTFRTLGPPLAIGLPAIGLLAVGLLAFGLLAIGCEQDAAPPVTSTRSEADQQVKKLREDNELEFQDLRGRWLAAKGELIRLRTELSDARATQVGVNSDLASRFERLEAGVIALGADMEALRREATQPPAPDDERTRLARSYEEIHCLRRRGAEEGVAQVYERYGFESLDAWASAWAEASRDERFEREVSARIARLCP